VRKCSYTLLVLAWLVALSSVTHAQRTATVLKPLSFLSGHWRSESPGEVEEEYWSPPVGESMVGTFRVVKDRDAVFYEFWAVEVEDGNAVFKMKHFNRGLFGWEDKNDMVRLALSVKAEKNVSFTSQDGNLDLRYEQKGDELISTLRRVKDGKTKEDVFRFRRSN
jgi:Domain of unknown function (DUF6265)